MKKIDHIGIAVHNLQNSNALFSKFLNSNVSYEAYIESEKMNVSLFEMGDNTIELMEPASEDSKIYKFLQTRGEGMHHVCFEVDNIAAEIERLKNEGFIPLTEKPYIGLKGKLVCFFHPKTTNGVLIELAQKIK